MLDFPLIVNAYVPVIVRRSDVQNEWGGYDTEVIRGVVPVEVLTVHFAKNKMRVRYSYMFHGKETIMAFDIPADSFFEEYQVIKKVS